jgi:hypothetical protein
MVFISCFFRKEQAELRKLYLKAVQARFRSAHDIAQAQAQALRAKYPKLSTLTGDRHADSRA